LWTVTYVDEIWFADRHLPSEVSDINNRKPELELSSRSRRLENR